MIKNPNIMISIVTKNPIPADVDEASALPKIIAQATVKDATMHAKMSEAV